MKSILIAVIILIAVVAGWLWYESRSSANSFEYSNTRAMTSPIASGSDDNITASGSLQVR